MRSSVMLFPPWRRKIEHAEVQLATDRRQGHIDDRQIDRRNEVRHA
jgi:hypothetical protein